ncbi:MAG: TonB-dependent receptor [Bacteroidota bacterium]
MKAFRGIFLFIFSLSIGIQFCHGANDTGSISGSVKDENGNAIPGITILIKGTSQGTASDGSGRFKLGSIASGSQTLVISGVGYQSFEKNVIVTSGQNIEIDLVLSESIEQMSEVVVVGQTEAQEISSKPITITSIDAISLRKQTLGVAEVLKRSTGVLVRQSGGLGSDTQINLNGLAGNAVRIYYDGIPLEYLGGGVEVNNLPVNLIDRIDVYKGVMPIQIGTDALGGGINIVPRQFVNDYFEVSQEYGSFNTHRTTLMGVKNLNEKIVIGGNAFFNYSDNDYEMLGIPTQIDVPFINIFGREDSQPVDTVVNARRFHDRHVSAFAQAQIGFNNLLWADRLTLSSSYSYRDDEIQHGQRVTERPAGEATREVRGSIQRLTFEKNVNNKLNLSYSGLYAVTKVAVEDSTDNIYNWLGEIRTVSNGNNAEILGRPALRNTRLVGTVHRLNARYELNDNISFAASDFFAYSRLTGNDPLAAKLQNGDERVDPLSIPSNFYQNIFGVEAKIEWLDDALTTTAFYKRYNFDAESIDFVSTLSDTVQTRLAGDGNNGFGTAFKYEFSNGLFIRSSYEKTTRLPTEREIFGDFFFIRPNFELRPETSDNINFGLYNRWEVGKAGYVGVDVNGFLRYSKDRIRLEAEGSGESARFINDLEVDSKGVEVALKASPIASIEVVANFTWQDVIRASVADTQDDSFIGSSIPNLADLFFNSSIQYKKGSLMKDEDELRVFWNYFYVDQFSITDVLDEESANPDNLVPVQHQHDLGFSYRYGQSGVSLAFQVNNLLNAQVFDNFRVPRPGRNYSVKISYSL